MSFAIGGVLGDAWNLYTRNSVRLIAVAALVFGILSVIDALVDASDSRALLPLAGAATIFGVLCLQAALTLLVDDFHKGRPARALGDLFGDVGPLLLTLLAAEIIATIAIVGGLILFVIPGLVILTFWVGFIPAIVLERKGVLESFRRSMALVQGNFLKVFAVIALTLIFSTIVATVVQAALAPLPDVVDVYVARVVANSIAMPFVAVAWTIMFFDLRAAKEGYR